MPEQSPPKRSRAIVLILLAAGLLVTSWLFSQQKETDIILITFPDGTVLETEVADTPEKIFFGLAFRDALPPDTGMLYIFETTDRHKAQTKGFRFPVDMIWVDESRHIVSVQEAIPPCTTDSCPSYGPEQGKVRYLIEVQAGYVKSKKIEAGAELKYTLRL